MTDQPIYKDEEYYVKYVIQHEIIGHRTEVYGEDGGVMVSVIEKDGTLAGSLAFDIEQAYKTAKAIIQYIESQTSFGID